MHVPFVRGIFNSRQTCQLHPALREAMQGVIDNVYEDVRDMMKDFKEFKSMGRFMQFLLAPEFERRLAKAEKAIERAENYIVVSSIK